MRVYVISDMHLGFDNGDFSKRQMRKAIGFIESIRGKVDMLIMNGDIFDFWMEWRNTIIGSFFPILRALAELHDDGCRLVLTAGNHDFWFRDFLQDEIGIEIVPDIFRVEIDGKKVFVAHGDNYTASDFRYHFYRSIIRFPLVRHLAGLFHPGFALWLVGKISRSNQRTDRPGRKVDRKREDGLTQSAKEILQQNDIVLFGHTHNPVVTKMENGVYANSGDWINNNSYLTLINGEVELHFWKEESS